MHDLFNPNVGHLYPERKAWDMLSLDITKLEELEGYKLRKYIETETTKWLSTWCADDLSKFKSTVGVYLTPSEITILIELLGVWCWEKKSSKYDNPQKYTKLPMCNIFRFLECLVKYCHGVAHPSVLSLLVSLSERRLNYIANNKHILDWLSTRENTAELYNSAVMKDEITLKNIMHYLDGVIAIERNRFNFSTFQYSNGYKEIIANWVDKINEITGMRLRWLFGRISPDEYISFPYDADIK